MMQRMLQCIGETPATVILPKMSILLRLRNLIWKSTWRAPGWLGHYLRVLGLSPTWSSLLSWESASASHPIRALSLSLSLK